MRRKSLLTCLIALCACWVIMASPARGQTTDSSKVEFFIMIENHPFWVGDNFGYTLDHPAKVEARISTLGGELIGILDIGEQQPGQYMLPWDGTVMDGVPLAGKYEFELFFDYDYAAHFWFLARPIALSNQN